MIDRSLWNTDSDPYTVDRKGKNGKVYTYWACKITFPPDPETGVKPKPLVFYGKNETEAKKKRKAYYLNPPKEGLDKATSFVDFVKDKYFSHLERRVTADEPSLSESRRKNKVMYLKNHLTEINLKKRPYLSKVTKCALIGAKLGKVTPGMVFDYFQALDEAGVSAAIKHMLKVDFNGILTLAKHKLPNKPSEYLEDINAPMPKRKKPKQLFDYDFIINLLDDETKTVEDRSFIAAQMALLCRPQDLWALTWADVDFEAGTVYIGKKVAQAPGGGWSVQDGGKTGDKSKRTNPAWTTLLRLLKAVKDEREAKGIDAPWVFLTEKGLQVHNERFDRVWGRLKRNLGLPDGPTFYSLKSLGNSWLAANGVAPEVRQKLMGHTTPRMAMSDYREVAEQEQFRAVALFEVQKPKGNVSGSGTNSGTNVAA